MNSGLTIKRDLTHKEQSTLAALQAHITAAGAKYQWGSTFTVYADGTSSNNGIYRLQYGKDDTSKTNPANLLKIGDNDDTFGSGGGSNTFTGGVSESGGTVVLGGSALTGITTIDLSVYSLRLQRVGGNNPFFSVGPSTIEMGYGGVGYINLNTGIRVGTDNILFKGTLPIGEADYSADLTDNALPQKIYVDSFLGGNALDSTVISPGATQDTGIIGWNQSNQEYEFVSNIGLGVGASGSTRSIDALGTSSDIQLQLNAKGNGSVVLSGFNQIFTNSGGNSVIITPGATATINPNGDEALLISAGVSSTGKGELLTLSGGAAHDTGDNDGGDLLLQGGASNGSGLRGSVQIKQVFKTITTTTYEVEESDWGKRLKFTNAAGCAVTLPNGLSDGLEFAAKRDTGAGVVSFTAATTLLSSGTEITTVQDWASVVHEGSDVWHAAGLN